MHKDRVKSWLRYKEDHFVGVSRDTDVKGCFYVQGVEKMYKFVLFIKFAHNLLTVNGFQNFK